MIPGKRFTIAGFRETSKKNVLVAVAPKMFCTVLIIPMRSMGMINTNSWQDSERLISSEHQDK